MDDRFLSRKWRRIFLKNLENNMDTVTQAALEQASRLYAKYETDEVYTWCGGCGNYAIRNALQAALSLEGIDRNEVIFCFDVGCSGNGSDKIEGYTIHGLHGRVLPLAAGVKLAHQKMYVVAEAGDGATFSEGVNHLVHAIRNNYPVLFIHHNNENYGLTTGQPSALTPQGCRMNAAPEGNPVEALSPLELVLSLRPSLLMRTSYAESDHMVEMMRQGLGHDGFVFLDVLQACPTYNRHTPHNWYFTHTQKTAELEDFDPTNYLAAQKLIQDPDKWYLGTLYQNDERSDFMDVIMPDGKSTQLVDTVRNVPVEKFLAAL